MRIIPLGVGSAFSQRFFHSNFVVEIDSKCYLIDAGTTLRYSLPEANLTPPDIDGIFITHFHSDHVGGLDELGSRYKYVHNISTDLFIHPDQRAHFDNYFALTGITPEDNYAPKAIDNKNPTFLALNSKTYQAKYINTTGRHPFVPSNFAIAIEEHTDTLQKRIIFTGDINSIPDELYTLISDKKTVAVVHDCYTKGPTDPAHFTLDKIIETYPEDVRSKIYITHYEDKIERLADKINAANLRIAKQGVAIEA